MRIGREQSHDEPSSVVEICKDDAFRGGHHACMNECL